MTLNCKGQLLDLTVPKVMGIVNVTPDSFFDGGKHPNSLSVLKTVETMLSDGATFIDIGGYSSRPNAVHISETEELQRVLPVVEEVLKEFPKALISIDTFRSNVADACLHAGAALINDISGGSLDDQMWATVAKHKAPFIMMHMKGTPQTMQSEIDYIDLLQEIMLYFSQKVAIAHKYGIQDIILDPGFGFAKTIPQNFEILSKLELLHIFQLPILLGVSRKSTIYKTLNTDAAHALNGTSVLHTFALGKGVHILRTHDVKEAVECIMLTEAIKAQKE